MQDVLDLNPDMTVEEIRAWADSTQNEALADYLRECADRHDA